jgi:hypothetical protein
MEVCDGPWTAAVIHPWPVNANMHVASERGVMISSPATLLCTHKMLIWARLCVL